MGAPIEYLGDGQIHFRGGSRAGAFSPREGSRFTGEWFAAFE